MEFDLPMIIGIELTNVHYGKITNRPEGYMQEKLYRGLIRQISIMREIRSIEFITYGEKNRDGRFKRFYWKAKLRMPWATIFNTMHIEKGLWQYTGERMPCKRAMNTMMILWDGRVVRCAQDIKAEDVIGDINKTSVAGIWNSLKAKNIRQKHQEKIFEGICSRCTFNSKVENFVDGPITEALCVEGQDANIQR